jgi:hypothetical protein
MLLLMVQNQRKNKDNSKDKNKTGMFFGVNKASMSSTKHTPK